MKKFRFMVLLTLILCIGLPTPAYADSTPFVDMQPGHWAYDAVSEAYHDKVMAGVKESSFAPDDKITLAQFVTILTRAFYRDEVESSTASGAWYAKYYDMAMFHHLLDGIVDNQHSYELLREDMAQIMYHVMDDQGVRFSDIQTLQTAKSKIPDLETVNLDHSGAVLACYSLGLLSGMDAQGHFVPKAHMTRAQTAVVYIRLKQAVQQWGGSKANLPKTAESLPKVSFSAEYMSSPYYQALQNVTLTGDYRQDIIAVALSQIGYGEGDAENQLDGSYRGSKNYTEYGRYFGSNGSAWCSEFASWCARAAKVPTSILGSSTSANLGKFHAPYYTWAQTVYAGGTYTPRPGDLALFALNGTSLTAKHLSHTAIVYDVESHEDTVKITVIDGNWGSTVKMRSCVAAISDGYMGKGYFAYFVAPKYE